VSYLLSISRLIIRQINELLLNCDFELAGQRPLDILAGHAGPVMEEDLFEVAGRACVVND
jgi:hypothetical protein